MKKIYEQEIFDFSKFLPKQPEVDSDNNTMNETIIELLKGGLTTRNKNSTFLAKPKEEMVGTDTETLDLSMNTLAGGGSRRDSKQALLKIIDTIKNNDLHTIKEVSFKESFKDSFTKSGRCPSELDNSGKIGETDAARRDTPAHPPRKSESGVKSPERDTSLEKYNEKIRSSEDFKKMAKLAGLVHHNVSPKLNTLHRKPSQDMPKPITELLKPRGDPLKSPKS